MIFIGAHHKTGSQLFKKVFSDISRELGLRLHKGTQSKLPAGTDIWYHDHSIIDRRRLPVVRGVHLIRHPLEVIVSGYRWHLVCHEKWCVSTQVKTPATGIRYDFDGMSYQEKLLTLSQSDGVLFEMKGRSFHSVMAMYRWDDSDPRFKTVRYEDVMRDFD